MSDIDVDLDLIRRAAAGEPVAQERFILKHRPALMRYLERHVPQDLRRHIEPRDVYQDVCFEVFRQIASFHADDPGMAIRWLLRIAHNRIVDLVRTHNAAKRGAGRQTELNDSADDTSVVRLLQDLAVYERTPSQSAMRHELHVLIEKCLDRLPDDYRLAIRYRYIEALPIDDIATKMDRSAGSVTMLCNRALKRLREDMRSFSRYL